MPVDLPTLYEIVGIRNVVQFTLFWFAVGEIVTLLLLCRGRIFSLANGSLLVSTMKPRREDKFDLNCCNYTRFCDEQSVISLQEVRGLLVFSVSEGNQGLQGIPELVQNRADIFSSQAKCSFHFHSWILWFFQV